jgi:hypothetical protein
MGAPWPTTTSRRNQHFTWSCVCAEETEEPMMMTMTNKRTIEQWKWRTQDATHSSIPHKSPYVMYPNILIYPHVNFIFICMYVFPFCISLHTV